MSVAAPESPVNDASPGPGPIDTLELVPSNINPITGLATDFLNHFNEAVMLLEMSADAPEFLEEFMQWQPTSYGEHFSSSHLKDREVALLAYATADPNARHCLDTLADTMTAILVATRETLQSELPPALKTNVATGAAERIKPLIARAGTVINGAGSFGRAGAPETPQDAVDALMGR